jgi:predicted GNAT family N-acyltransferase
MRIALATSDDDIEACLTLRRSVFVEEQNVPEDLELDGEDPQCRHVLAMENGLPVGTARFRQIGESIKVQRVCVPQMARGSGIGAKIMSFIIETAKAEQSAGQVSLSSQKDAIPFYEKLGFEAYGEEYMDAGIAHRDMTLKL